MSSTVKNAVNSIAAPAQKLIKKSDSKGKEMQQFRNADSEQQPQEESRQKQSEDSLQLPSSSSQKSSQQAGMNNNKSISIVKYIVDSIDSIVDQICQRVLSIPMQIRYFAKAIYDFEIMDKQCDEKKAFLAVQQYLLEKWLSQVAFKDMVVHGLTKTYFVKQNALSNLQLMGIGLNKIFSMDGKPFEDEFLQPLNVLFKKK